VQRVNGILERRPGRPQQATFFDFPLELITLVALTLQGEPEGGAPGGAAEKAPRKRTTAADLDASEVDALVG
jgi:hypothetical protein